MAISTFLQRQAAYCARLARMCSDPVVAEKLQRMSVKLTLKADEVEERPALAAAEHVETRRA